MKILAFDTALGACSTALLSDGLVKSEISIEMARGHAEHLMGQVQEALDQANTTFDDLDRIAVTIGPGTFTGLRVGLSAARGMGLALSIPVVGVTSLQALAYCGINQDVAAIASLIDARNNETYGQLFTPDLVPVCEPQRWSYATAANNVERNLNAEASILLVGSGSKPVIELIGSSATQKVVTHSAQVPRASDIARLAATPSIEDISPPRPLYLRPPDAKPPQKSQFVR